MTFTIGGVVRARLDLSYDGTNFSGWGVQPALRTVQGELERALCRVVRGPEGSQLEPSDLRVTVAGRTDAGVHARGQVAHVDITPDSWQRLGGRSTHDPAQVLRERVSGVLPNDIVIHSATPAHEGFDARFSALERRYIYRIADNQAGRDPLTRRYVTWADRDLDVEALNEASATLAGLRDFAVFCKPREGATTVRDLKQFSWERVVTGADAGLVIATVRADAFCHSMVRSLVGAVTAIGTGKRDLGWLAALAAKDRRDDAIEVAPARGLTLEEVLYPPDAELAARAQIARARRGVEVCG
ncbi:tRNA pseudouridine(38-40) synthase TruA [Demequina lutea]|uniref:tRNA pseudouridine synthase A n=1 Tax=Demequina lutea TaxID=431489 RepID=A0A7Y9Z9B8_9MICO|nr:tRNA pseudouridine(38-40) synthase TruA [Demequina lutea]NYI40655.1 tRNA pseudouridine38-40 synthase [Demequina lutea]